MKLMLVKDGCGIECQVPRSDRGRWFEGCRKIGKIRTLFRLCWVVKRHDLDLPAFLVLKNESGVRIAMKKTICFSLEALAISALICFAFENAGLAQNKNWNKTISVEVRAPDHKPNGKTWDLDIPVMIGALMPTLGDPAPDMMLCVVDGAGASSCIHKAERNAAGVPYSICQNAYVCDFTN